MGEFDKTLGPLLIGIFLNTYIYGIVMFQFASYQNIRFNDPYWIKAPVGVLFMIDTFHSAVAIYIAWTYCVEGYTNPAAQGVASWAYTISPICTAVIGAVTHVFLGYRFFRLTKNAVAYGGALALSVVVFGLAVATGAWGLGQSLSMNELLANPAAYRSLVTPWLCLQTILDGVIAASLGYALSHCRPPFMSAEVRATRILRGGVQVGVVAFLFSLASLIGFLAAPKTNIFWMFALPMGRVYSNILMDTLLSRHIETPDISPKPTRAARSTHDIWVPTAAASPIPANSFSLHSIHVKTEVFSDGGRNTPQHSRTPSEDYRTEKGEAV